MHIVVAIVVRFVSVLYGLIMTNYSETLLQRTKIRVYLVEIANIEDLNSCV